MYKEWVIILILATAIPSTDIAVATSGKILPLVGLHQYWNPEATDHYYETNEEDLSSIGWNYEGVACYVFSPDTDESLMNELGLVKLHQYWNPEATDHYYETNEEDLSSIGWNYEGVACYVFPPEANAAEVKDKLIDLGYQDVPEIVKLYQYWNPEANDHYYETNEEDLSNIGWNYEGVACLVFPRRSMEG